jgi:hypothetical protein
MVSATRSSRPRKFLAAQTFDLAPQAAIAGRIARISAFGDDALDLVVAVVQGSIGVRRQTRETLPALDERPRHPVFSVEVQ